jgi:hypothetical protein
MHQHTYKYPAQMPCAPLNFTKKVILVLPSEPRADALRPAQARAKNLVFRES